MHGKGLGVGGKRQGDGGTDICIGPKGQEKPHKRGTTCIQQYGKGWKGKGQTKNEELLKVILERLLEVK